MWERISFIEGLLKKEESEYILDDKSGKIHGKKVKKVQGKEEKRPKKLALK